jgi:hypothetical protein
MIRVLCQEVVESVGQEIASTLQSAYKLTEVPEVLADDAVWDGTKPSEGDDVLLVVYQSRDLAPAARTFIEAFRDAHALTDPETGQRRPGGVVIPVATNPESVKPPDPISGIKALVYDDAAKGEDGRLAHWVGIFLGMLLRPGEHQIFISYRATDGREIADDLYRRLETAGFHPWLDEAKENLPPAGDVQRIINDQLKRAAMVLVVDTLGARESDWIRLEIAGAIGDMIPVLLPVVVGAEVSRFPALSQLQRRVPVKPDGVDRQPLTDEEWRKILGKVEDLLLEAYRRRLRTAAHMENVFRKHGYEWVPVDAPRRIFEARRKRLPMPDLFVLSHCSVHEAMWIPALKAYAKYLQTYPAIARINHKVCVYDRAKSLADAEFNTIYDELPELPFFLVNRDELPILLASNFGAFRLQQA